MYINACLRDSSTTLGQAPRRVSVSSGVSVGRRCFLCISSVGAWTALFAALHNETSSHDAAEPRIRSKGKGTHACRVGVSRKFGACTDVKCAPSHYIYIIIYIEKSLSVVRLGWLAPARQLCIIVGAYLIFPSLVGTYQVLSYNICHFMNILAHILHVFHMQV